MKKILKPLLQNCCLFVHDIRIYIVCVFIIVFVAMSALSFYIFIIIKLDSDICAVSLGYSFIQCFLGYWVIF